MSIYMSPTFVFVIYVAKITPLVMYCLQQFTNILKVYILFLPLSKEERIRHYFQVRCHRK